ncbi:hypothetical protein LCGC14_2797950 [marine sediment metagenome]|uniref:Uncharacterized protein n=1 Tax=marine sediment metagenome TaxID=412755 RepID=A0A0F8ZAN6_9ZZZZ
MPPVDLSIQYDEAVIFITLIKKRSKTPPKVMEMTFKKPKIDVDYSVAAVDVESEPGDTTRKVKAGLRSLTLRVREQ